jgi:hypothetical protein
VQGPHHQGSQLQQEQLWGWGRGCFGRGLTSSCLHAGNNRGSRTVRREHSKLRQASHCLQEPLFQEERCMLLSTTAFQCEYNTKDTWDADFAQGSILV